MGRQLRSQKSGVRSQNRRRRCAGWLLSSGFCLLSLLHPLSLPAADGDKAFAVLRAKCLPCHDRKLHSGKLVMETTADLLKGGSRGPAITPGKSGESRLLQMVKGELSPKMPLEGELSPEEIGTLSAWIDAGAPAWSVGAFEPTALTVPEIKPQVAVRPQVSCIVFSPDGSTIAVAGYKETRLLDSHSLKQRSALNGPTDLVRALAYSPDGRILAAAGGGPARYGEIVLWDVASGKALRTLRGHSDYIYGVAFSPDGKRLASSSYDRLIKIWDAETGGELKTFREHTDAVFPLMFSPNGKWLASGAADRTVKIWDMETGRRLHTLSDSGDVVFTLAFHPSGQKLSAAGGDRYIRTWSVGPDGWALAGSIIAHESEITRIAYLPDGKHLVSAAADRTLKIWNMDNGEAIKVIGPQPDWILSLALSPDGKVLAVGRYDGSIALYDIQADFRESRSSQ